MKWPRIPRPDIDLRDMHVYGGLALAAWGGWHLSPAWTAIAIGTVITLMGVFAARIRGKGA